MHDPALHHIHLRKRFAKRFIDRLIYVVGIAGPFFSIPQLLEIWRDHNAAGISIFTWTSYCAMSLIWLIYGLVHKEKPIIYSQAIWFLSNFAVTIGAVIYG